MELQEAQKDIQALFPKSVKVNLSKEQGRIVLTAQHKDINVSVALQPDIPIETLVHDTKRRLGLNKITKKNYKNFDRTKFYTLPAYDLGTIPRGF